MRGETEGLDQMKRFPEWSAFLDPQGGCHVRRRDNLSTVSVPEGVSLYNELRHEYQKMVEKPAAPPPDLCVADERQVPKENPKTLGPLELERVVKEWRARLEAEGKRWFMASGNTMPLLLDTLAFLLDQTEVLSSRVQQLEWDASRDDQ